MKTIIVFILSLVVYTSAFADNQVTATDYYFGGYDGEISQADCVALEVSISEKLQVLGTIENQTADTFSVKTWSSFTHNSHRQLVYLCRGAFTSKNQNYHFVVDQTLTHYGSIRNSACALDKQRIEQQSDVLATTMFLDQGWVWNLRKICKSSTQGASEI